jgi:hypothetical protein
MQQREMFVCCLEKKHPTEWVFILGDREYIVWSKRCSVYSLSACLESSLCQLYKIAAYISFAWLAINYLSFSMELVRLHRPHQKLLSWDSSLLS